MTDPANASNATTVDMLRAIHPDAWAEITEPSGWSYSTNIDVLAHRAASELSELEEKIHMKDGNDTSELLNRYYHDPNTDDIAMTTTPENKAAIAALDAYLNDPDTDDFPYDFPNAGEFQRLDLSRHDDPHYPFRCLAALLLGLCVVTGAAAFVVATGGGVGEAVAVLGWTTAAFGLGVTAGRRN